MDRKIATFTFVTFMVGFMLAIQFQTTQEPVIRDTRDTRELRQELQQEQERRQQLSDEIERMQTLLAEYEQSLEQRQEVDNVLENQIRELESLAGLTEVSGPGLVITLQPIVDDSFYFDQRRDVSPQLLRTLLNELNIYQAKEIAVGQERIITTSTVREVNRSTLVNSRRLPSMPIEIKVLSDDVERLQNQMVVSESIELAELEGLEMSFQQREHLTLPAYRETPRVLYMKELKEE